jgi:hypothetical protein
MDEQRAAASLADEWLSQMSAIDWSNAAASIRRRYPAPCGETTQVDQHGFTLEVSDSWEWLESEGGDIRLTVDVFRRGNARLATRTATIRKS